MSAPFRVAISALFFSVLWIFACTLHGPSPLLAATSAVNSRSASTSALRSMPPMSRGIRGASTAPSLRKWSQRRGLDGSGLSRTLNRRPPPTSERSPFLQEFTSLRATTEKEETKKETLHLAKSELDATPKSSPPENEPKKPNELDLIVERGLDTVEDAFVHARRIPYDLGWTEELRKEDIFTHEDDRETVVVLGSGWGAHALMKVADTFGVRLIVISPSNHFVFTPMLASASVGTVEYRSMTEAVRAANPMVDYVEGHAVDVDVENKIVKVELESLLKDLRGGNPPIVDIKYDKLVVSVGCKVADDLVPGAKEHALRLKSCNDALLLRNAVGECLEFASRPDVAFQSKLTEAENKKRKEERRSRATFAIVGGGPTGVELAGEMMDFIKDIRRARVGAYASLEDVLNIVLIHGGTDILPQFDKVLRDGALQTLREEGIDVRLSTRVLEVGDGYVKIAPKGDESNVEVLRTGLTVWAAGTGPVDFAKTLREKLPPEAAGIGGRINVDPWLRCPMPSEDLLGSILVMGDVASFPADNPEFRGFLPQTAQVAGQQGAYAARLLSRGYDLTQTPPAVPKEKRGPLYRWLKLRGADKAPRFSFLNLGQLAYLGDGKALSQINIGNFPLLRYAGSASYILWRSVYLVKQVATRNRVLVSFDWLKSALFGRDVTRL